MIVMKLSGELILRTAKKHQPARRTSQQRSNIVKHGHWLNHFLIITFVESPLSQDSQHHYSQHRFACFMFGVTCGVTCGVRCPPGHQILPVDHPVMWPKVAKNRCQAMPIPCQIGRSICCLNVLADIFSSKWPEKALQL